MRFRTWRAAARLALVANCVVVAAAPRRAAACHEGADFGGLIYAVVAIPVDVALTIHDLTASDPSRGYGVAELLLATPLVIVAINRHSRSTTCTEDGSRFEKPTFGGKGFGVVIGAWSAALAVHGLWTVARSRRVDRAPPPAIAVVPTLVSGGVTIAPGLAVAGTF